jgi:hypothetical protein
MLKNPYLTPEDPGQQAALRFATYLDGEDKALLMSIRPIRGTAQAVINNLIRNICNDLRDLGINHFCPDADDILAVLVESRPLTASQIERLRRTTFGTAAEIPTRLHEHRGRSEVRERPADHSVSAHNTPRKTSRGKQHSRKETAKTKKDTKTQS